LPGIDHPIYQKNKANSINNSSCFNPMSYISFHSDLINIEFPSVKGSSVGLGNDVLRTRQRLLWIAASQ